MSKNNPEIRPTPATHERHKVMDLDAMLSPEEAASWFGVSIQTLMKMTHGRDPKIPAFKLSRKVIRFHPRTVIAKLAKDARVPFETMRLAVTQQQVPAQPVNPDQQG